MPTPAIKFPLDPSILQYMDQMKSAVKAANSEMASLDKKMKSSNFTSQDAARYRQLEQVSRDSKEAIKASKEIKSSGFGGKDVKKGLTEGKEVSEKVLRFGSALKDFLGGEGTGSEKLLRLVTHLLVRNSDKIIERVVDKTSMYGAAGLAGMAKATTSPQFIQGIVKSPQFYGNLASGLANDSQYITNTVRQYQGVGIGGDGGRVLDLGTPEEDAAMEAARAASRSSEIELELLNAQKAGAARAANLAVHRTSMAAARRTAMSGNIASVIASALLIVPEMYSSAKERKENQIKMMLDTFKTGTKNEIDLMQRVSNPGGLKGFNRSFNEHIGDTLGFFTENKIDTLGKRQSAFKDAAEALASVGADSHDAENLKRAIFSNDIGLNRFRKQGTIKRALDATIIQLEKSSQANKSYKNGLENAAQQAALNNGAYDVLKNTEKIHREALHTAINGIEDEVNERIREDEAKGIETTQEDINRYYNEALRNVSNSTLGTGIKKELDLYSVNLKKTIEAQREAEKNKARPSKWKIEDDKRTKAADDFTRNYVDQVNIERWNAFRTPAVMLD